MNKQILKALGDDFDAFLLSYEHEGRTYYDIDGENTDEAREFYAFAYSDFLKGVCGDFLSSISDGCWNIEVTIY